MPRPLFIFAIAAGLSLPSQRSPAADRPVVKDPALQLTMFAEAPDIVTPIYCDFDAKGRLLVIESQTHQRDKNYQGPPKDRIRILEDTNGDGKADRIRTFYEGTESTMSIARGADGWMYVATRMKIFRIRDTNGDDVADQEEELFHLETKGNYPHNGLCGLVFDKQGELYFGIGENLGETFQLVGKDGTRLRGAGEGGIFHCRADGTKLRRVAIGLWNPFGICVDPHGQVFAVDNDPDGCPPCRLVHIVETGDYGFNFKYGRSGKHPLQAWNGELPGTLPYAAATGEAPCAVVPYHGQLYSASWGDHRIERFKLIPFGSSFRASRESVVDGGENFRPVGIAIAPDDSLYFTDWVDKSYPVHGKGRVWKLTWKTKPEPAGDWPRVATDATTDDAFQRQRQVAKLNETTWAEAKAIKDPVQRLIRLQALRWRERLAAAQGSGVPPVEELAHFLADDDVAIRMYVMRWIADERINKLHAAVKNGLTGVGRVSPELFKTWIATIEMLDRGTPISFHVKESSPYLIQTVLDANQSPELKALALKFTTPQNPKLTVGQLVEWAQGQQESLRQEAVRTLVLRGQPESVAALVKLAENPQADVNCRADAVAGLTPSRLEHTPLLHRLTEDKNPAVVTTAKAVLNAAALIDTTALPAPTELDAWEKLLNRSGDANSGWRTFFLTKSVHCSDCHRLDGRGSPVGPDLTDIGKRIDRRKLIQSILQPSHEIGPTYVPYILETEDGRVLTGLSQGFNEAGTRETFLGPDGKSFELAITEIESRKMSTKSLMPDGLEKVFTAEELADILAALGSSPPPRP